MKSFIGPELSIRQVIILLAVCMICLSPGGERANAAEDSTIIYDQKYFEQYKPTTLEDMVRKIPGGVTILSDLNRQARSNNNRGFGSSGAQFLINGKRMSGKSNGIVKQLTRIQSSQVDHIELIRGTAEGLDIRNEGILINVVMKEGAQASSTFVKLKGYFVREAGAIPELLISHNSSTGNLEYGVSYEYDTWLAFTHIDEDILDDGRALKGLRFRTSDKKDQNHTFTGNIKYDFENGDAVRLNGLFNIKEWRSDASEDQFDIDPLGMREFSLVEKKKWQNKRDNWEIGGDYEGKIDGLGALKALFVINRAVNDDLFSSHNIIGGSRFDDFIFKNDFVASEKIFRASLTSALGRHTLDYGAEGAFNTLDKTVISDSTPENTNDDTPENTVVQENRYELFATYSFSARDDLNLQTSLVGEFSKIIQKSQGNETERSFQYLKPRFEARYDMTGQDQFRFVAERTVSQLNLNDFVVSRNNADDLFNFGNPDLVQEKIWTYSLSYERRFANDGGSLELSLDYEDISDHIDKILIENAGEISSGVGNIGDAHRLGANVNLNVRFGFIDLPTAVMTVKYNYKDSEATDPFTNEKRPIRRTGTHFWSIDFQHDVIDWDMTYGFNIYNRSPLFRQDLFLREETTFRRHMSLYTEYRLRENMKLRLDLQYLLHNARTNDKTFYEGPINEGVIDHIEVQERSENRQAIVELQMSF